MTWGRLALLQVAGEEDAKLQKMATVFGYVKQSAPEPLIVDDADTASHHTTSTLIPFETTPDVAIPQRPPARFLRVNKIIRSTEPDKQASDYLHDPAMRLLPNANSTDSYHFAPPPPLLPLSRLIPFLLNSLGVSRTSKRLDQQQLARQVALGKALQRLPQMSRQHWAQRLHIIVDAGLHLEPYWGDFARVIQQFKALLGEDAVEAIRFEDTAWSGEIPDCIPWPGQADDEWQQWQLPPADVPILVLGDLGVTADNVSASAQWSRLLKVLRSHPAPLLTLSPVMRSPRQRWLCRTFKPHPLNDAYRLPRHPGQNGFALTAVLSVPMSEILALLSCLPVVDTGLLRRLRLALHWGGSEREGEIWNHPDIRRIGLGIRLDERVAEHYRQDYQAHFAGSQQAETLWQLVQAHHASAFEGLRQLEKLNQCVLEQRDDAALRDYLQRLCATVTQEGQGSARHKILVMQCRTILASKPESIWSSEHNELAYHLFGVAYAEDIRAGKWPEQLEKDFDPARLQWVLDAKAREEWVQWQVVQVGDQGQFKLQQAQRADGLAITPVAEFSALRGLPPTVLFAPIDGGQHSIAVEGAVYQAEQGLVGIESATHRVELQAITKPSWASQIWRDKKGLQAEVVFAGKVYTVLWREATDAVISYWEWPKPFGQEVLSDINSYQDGLGLYADLDIKGITQRFRWIEPGTFLMGSPESETDREPWINGSETQHPVTLTQGFWLADTTVTQSLWQAVMGKNPSSFTDSHNNPVEQVSWNDSQEFIKKLNGLLPGLQAKLPTEAQWEYACRAGTTTPFSFGNNITPEQVNYDGNYPYANGEKGLYREKTVPVKSLPANPWGLYEMHGNVWEWCQDVWQEKLPASPVKDPEGVAGGDQAGVKRVVRGGSWYINGRLVRSAFRYRYDPAERFSSLGFRLVLGLELQPAQQGGGTAKQEERTAGTQTGASGTPRQAGSAPGAVDKAGKFVKGLKNLFGK
ncbi:formylglycine-generating enzyme family protein [Thiothrix winogradskyi]|uniref:Formylglycine-generating enzyme family protein n=1 Tax=Thiothrix winogradskyi TaxID=96472 RepID=A0ABY3SVY5_9GAMM|nr:formylglycine-generating enzyme family protein [Thiothrix winogradskyi]UJS23112.1 formylglycine-generating enzyme family protein [Thiothrix winogradskyi]